MPGVQDSGRRLHSMLQPCVQGTYAQLLLSLVVAFIGGVSGVVSSTATTLTSYSSDLSSGFS